MTDAAPTMRYDQCTVYLIRHAQPTNLGNATLRYDVPPGPPLSNDGRMQAAVELEQLSNLK